MRRIIIIALLVASAASLGLAAGPAPQTVVHKPAASYRIAGGKALAQLYFNATTGNTDAALTVLTFEPGATVAEHAHDKGVEVLYVESGEMEMTLGGVTTRIGPGSAVYVPAGAKHQARVPEKGTAVKAVQVFVPPGPEQRFTAGERVKD